MLAHYLTVALRNLRRSPVTTLVNMVTLALGLACFVTAAAVVDYWEKSERHFENADRIAVISTKFEAVDGSFATSAMPWTAVHLADYLETDFPELENVARVIPGQETGIANADRSVGVFRLIAEPEFLEIFDLPFLAGDSHALDQPSSVVLTQEIATQLFGDQDPMGQPVIIAGIADATVTGVVARVPDPSHLGEAESSPLSFDIIASWNTWEAIQRMRGRPWPLPEIWGQINTLTYALLPADGSLTVDGFTARLESFAERHVPPEQMGFATLEISAIPVTGIMTSYLNTLVLGGGGMGGMITVPGLLLLLGGLILGIACLNFANLATARAAGRAREVGMRKAMGARRSEVILQYLFEAAALTAFAVALAAATLAITAPILRNTVDIDLGASLFIGVNFWVSLVLLILVVAVVAGFYPAFVLSAVRPVTALRLGRSKSGSQLVGKILVGAQFAASSFLLIAVIVMLSQNSELRRTGLGTGSDLYVVIDNPSQLSGIDPPTLKLELLNLPQVSAVTGIGNRPWSLFVNLSALSRSPEEGAQTWTVFNNYIGEDFFSVFEMELLAGRDFDPNRSDDLAPTGGPETWRPHNIIVDTEFVTELGFESPEAAIDEVVYNTFDEMEYPLTIVGVVESRPMHFIGAGATSGMYRYGEILENAVARISASDVSGAVEGITALWRRMAPNNPLNMRFTDDLFDESYETFNRVSQIFVGLAIFAFIISTVGLFAMAVQVANRRMREIGVRKTMGATTGQIVKMLLVDFSKPVIIANVIAWPLAFFAAVAYLNVFLHRIPLTPVPFILSLVVTLGVAWVAVGSQAYRAARVQPAEVLRYE